MTIEATEAAEAAEASVRVGSLGARLADILRERIIRGEFAHGTRLVEGVLAKQFDVSRGPVRDALSILMAQGLVEPKRQGVVVRGLTASDIEEIYTLRMAIEGLALQRAIERHHDDPAAWAAAEHEMGCLLEAAVGGDLRDYAEHDLAFHSEFYRLAEHARLQHIWNQFRPIFAVILKLANEQDADLRPSAKDHEILLSLARRGDVASARAVLDSHLRGSLARIKGARGA